MTDHASSFTKGEIVTDKNVVTCLSGAAITKGVFVKISSGTGEIPTVVTATANSGVLGVALKSAASGEYIPVLIQGITKMTLGAVTGTLAAGSAVCSDANGNPVALSDQSVDEGGTATYTIYYNAKAGKTLQDGQTGDEVLVKLED